MNEKPEKLGRTAFRLVYIIGAAVCLGIGMHSTWIGVSLFFGLCVVAETTP